MILKMIIWAVAFFVFSIKKPFVEGCTTPGIMPLRDYSYSPFCCHPSYGDAHCPQGARCERDTYYGHGFICCGSVNMVWDAYGGNYQKSDYIDCGKTAPKPTAPVWPSWPSRWPRWNGWNALTKDNADYESIPSNWTGDQDGPLVAPIIVGEYREIEDSKEGGGWRGKGSVTLVRDGSCTILVDTGSAVDEKMIIKGLAAYGLRIEDIQYVVITQGTPDHMGNQNLFAKSKIFYAWIMIDWDHFVMTDLGKNDFVRLCSRTELHLTPGVTKDAISLLVRDVAKVGTVAIVGDLFLYDHAYDLIPKQFAGFVWDVQALLQSREKIICQTDLIVPGHGAKFFSQRNNKTFMDNKYNCTNVINSLTTINRTGNIEQRFD